MLTAMSVPDAMRIPTLRRFPLRRRDVEASHERLRLVVPKSSQDLLTAGWSPGDLPHWADVWPASVAFARHLLRQSATWRDRRVVDLGCGLGVAGIAAAKRGADVLFADLSDDALEFARFNVAQNDCAERARFRRFDWAREDLPECDVLILSDVTYEYKALSALLRHVERIAAWGGSVHALDPWRPTANDFVDRLERRFDAEVRELETAWGGARHRIRYCRFGRA